MKDIVKRLTENTSFACPCINSSFVMNLNKLKIVLTNENFNIRRIHLSETKNQTAGPNGPNFFVDNHV